MKNNVPFVSYEIVYNGNVRKKEGEYYNGKSRFI